MSEQIVINDAPETVISPEARRRRPRRVYAGMWGLPEMIAIGAGLFAILVFVLLLAFLVFPAQRELDRNRATRTDLENKLTTARARYGSITSTQERVNELIRSTDDFETRFLRSENEAKVAIYQRINGLMSALRLTNTSGPDYAPLEVNDINRTQSSEEKSGRSKLVSIFPGVYVSVTVDGTYQNLRRFIRELETGGDFIVISTVELEPSETKEKIDPTRPPPANIADQKVDRGKKYGETVTLRIEMAGYYRRSNFSPMPAKTE